MIGLDIAVGTLLSQSRFVDIFCHIHYRILGFWRLANDSFSILLLLALVIRQLSHSQRLK